MWYQRKEIQIHLGTLQRKGQVTIYYNEVYLLTNRIHAQSAFRCLTFKY